MPPVLRVRMPVAIAQVGIIPEDKICKICKDDLQAEIREATSVLQEEKEKEKEKENGTIPREKTDSPDEFNRVMERGDNDRIDAQFISILYC
jgi:hypothetical protein